MRAPCCMSGWRAGWRVTGWGRFKHAGCQRSGWWADGLDWLRMGACHPIGGRLVLKHAHLRISLRSVREGQRNPGALQPLEREQVPALRINKALEEVLGLCLVRRRQCERASRVPERRGWMLRRRRMRQAPALMSGPAIAVPQSHLPERIPSLSAHQQSPFLPTDCCRLAA